MITDRIYRSLRPFPVLQRQLKRVIMRLPSRRRVVGYAGSQYAVDPTELHGFYLYYEQQYDIPIFRMLEHRLHQFRRAIDIGANIGIYSIFLAKRVAQVDAFEPAEILLPKLKANVDRNKLTNVRIYQSCIGNCDGTVHFSRPPRSNQGVGSITGERPSAYPTRSTTLDAFLEGERDVPLFIKMDIEGAEWLAWQGAVKRFATWRSPISCVMEVHQDIEKYGGSLPALADMINAAGFNIRGIGAAGVDSLEPLQSRHWFCERC